MPVTEARNASASAGDALGVSFRPRVLIIDDDEAHGDLIKRALLDQSVVRSETQFDINVITDATSALPHLDKDNIDIYCVDLRLRDSIPFESDEAAIREGLDLIDLIKTRAPTAGIIAITSVGDDRGAINNWSLGADAYIRKPVAAGIYRANVLTLWMLIRKRRLQKRSFRIGEWTFLLGSRTVKNGAGEIKRLSAKEYLLLRHLVTADNNQIDRSTYAMYASRETDFDEDRSVDSVKKRLIKKLGDSVEIIQVRDEGYRLISVEEEL